MRLLYVIILLVIVTSAFGQSSRGTIITPATPAINPMDPNGDGKIYKAGQPFSTDGYYVDEFEFKMFGIPKVEGDVPGDNQNGPNCGITDLIPDRDGYSAYAFKDANNNLIFRFRLGDNANSVESWHILMDTDGQFGIGKDPNANGSNPGFEIDITLINKQSPGVFVTNIDGATGCGTSTLFYPLNTNFQVSVADIVTCGDPDYFYDMWVPFNQIAQAFNITTATGVRFAASTSSSATCSLSGSTSDIAGVDNDAAPYAGCDACAFSALVSSQCPTTIADLCETCEGFSSGFPDKPGIDEPILALQQIITGTAKVGTFLKLEVYEVTSITSLDTTWSSTAREQHVVAVSSNGTWSVTLDAPLKPYDRIVARAQLTIDGTGCDSNNANNTSSTSVTVAEPNVAPVAIAQSLSTPEDTPLSITLTATDSDTGDQSILTYSVVTPPQHGTLSCSNCANPVYTPAANYNGSDSFTFQAKDRVVYSTAKTISITITAVNDSPVAGNDSFTINEDNQLNSTVATNDSDVDGPSANYTVVTAPAHGSLTLNTNGTFTYTPASNYNGSDSFVYSLCDNGTPNQCAQATASITINAVNDAPVANNDSFTTNEDVALSNSVATNDDVNDGPGAVYTLTASPSFGTIAFSANGTFVYTPNANYNGNDSFSYSLCDGGTPNLCSTATANITINSVNDAPIANGDSFVTDEDTPLSANVAANDNANDGPSSIYSVVTNPSHGNLVLNPNGTFTYTPNADYNGSDNFTYNLCDAGNPNLCSSATVSITINSVNDAPVAVNDSFSTNEDTPLTASVAANDNSTDGPLSVYSISTTPLHGVVTFNSSGNFSYTPNANYNGSDNFTYSLCDGSSPNLCSTATVSIIINSLNDAPIANNDSFTTNEDIAISGATVVANDDGTDGPSAIYSVSTNPSHGSLTLNANGTFTYTPNADYNGNDSFVYSLCDGGTPNLCSTATVSITINAVNDAPIANNDNFITIEDTAITGATVSTNDDGTDGPLSIYSLATNPTHGTVSLNSLGVFMYTPNADYNGSDSFTYNLCDGATSSLCSTATVSITISPVNDPPIANNDSFTTNEDVAITGASVASNDNATDGPSSLYSVIANPAHGTLVLNANGTFNYTPNANYNGSDNFTYNLCDGATTNLCSTASVTITINSVNDPPVATNDSFTTNEDTAITNASVATNDDGTDGPLALYSLVSNPTHGSISFNSLGTFTYTPNANYNGGDSFTYNLCDGASTNLCNMATVTITINAVNDAPIANNDTFTTNEDTAITGASVASNDDTNDGPSSVFSVSTNPSHGSLTLNANGTFNYTPNANYNGNDSFTYSLCDGANPDLCSTATVSITVNSVNDSPIANDDSFTTNEDVDIISANVASNDDATDGPLSVYSVATPPTNGTLTLNTNGTFTYTPDLNYNGSDGFAYNLCDGNNPDACSQATVTITINAVNDAANISGSSFVTYVFGGVVIDNSISIADVDNGTLQGATVTISGNFVAGDLLSFTDQNGITGSYNAAIGVLTLSGSSSISNYATALASIGYQNDSGTSNLTRKISFVVNDGSLNSASHNTFVDFPSNSGGPVLNSNSFSVNEDVALSACLNVSDPDGDNVVINNFSNLTSGTLTLTGGVCFTFTPASNFNGVVTVDVNLCDQATPSICQVYSVTINVNSVNDPPGAVADVINTDEDTQGSVNVITNDTDVDNAIDPTTVDLDPSTPSIDNSHNVNGKGSFSVDGSGKVTFIPAADFFGTVVINYTVADIAGATSNSQTITVTVNSVNDAPLAVNDSFNTNEDVTLSGTVATNDDPTDGPQSLYSIATNVMHGNLTFNGDGTFMYVPNANYNGSDSFTYNLCDGATTSLCSAATVTIVIQSVNDSPIANDDSFSTDEDISLTGVTVTTNDDSTDGPQAIFSVLTNPTHGALTLNTDGSFTYVPSADFNGTDFFTYNLCDASSGGLCQQALVTIQVNAVNDSPVAINDNFTSNEDVALNGDVSLNDNLNDGPQSNYTVLTNVVHGTLTLNNNGTFTYSPNANYNGADSFTYSVCDGANPDLCSTASSTITIQSVNDAPVAVADSFMTGEEQALSTSAAANDNLTDDVTAIYTLINNPSSGNVVFNADGSFIYTPSTDFNGIDVFAYQVCDGGGLCDQGIVSITVTAINDAPVVTNDSFTILEDAPVNLSVATNDFDVDGPALAYTVVTNSVNGILSMNTDGTFSYQSNQDFNGNDSFVYQVCDGGSPNYCIQGSASILINPVNDAPIANDINVSVNEDGVINVQLTASDIDNLPTDMIFSIVTNPSHATVVNNGGGSFTITLDQNYFGSDSFEFVVNDGALDSNNKGKVTISVLSVNDDPVAVNDSFLGLEDTPAVFSLVINDTDVDGSVDAATVDLNPSTPSEDKTYGITSQGTYTVDVNGIITFTPVANYNGLVTAISYTVKDNDGLLSNTGTIQVTLAAVNDPPSITTTAVTVSEDFPTIICLNVIDVEGDPAVLQYATSLDGNGTVTLSPLIGPYCFRYLSNPNLSGSDRVQVNVCDANNPGVCTSALINITITPVNDPPTILINGQPGSTITGTTVEDTPLNFCFDATDAEGDNISIGSITNVSGGGTLSLTSTTGSTYCFLFTPAQDYDGLSEWTISVCDNANPSLCSNVTVKITVTPVQDPPIADDMNISVLEDTPKALVLAGHDPDNDPISYTIKSNPSHGTLSGSGSNISYTPEANFNGTDNFTYQVSDNFSSSNIATVNISVSPVNDAPVITFIPVLTTAEDSILQVCIGVTDVDGDAVIFQTPVNTEGGGSFMPSPQLDFCFDFTPPSNFNGEAKWQLTVCDNGSPSQCATVVIVINVDPRNDAPIAVNDNLSATGNELTDPFNALANDIDIDGDELTMVVTPVAGPYHGSVTLNSNGTLTYQSDLGYIGSDSVRYRVCDSGNPSLCDEAVVFIEVDYSTFKIYEGLSPNNDGLNDYWRIDGIEKYPNNTVRVFDRYNNMVFERHAYDNAERSWRGQSNHGIGSGNLSEGTYYYAVDLGDGSKLLSGFVVLKKN